VSRRQNVRRTVEILFYKLLSERLVQGGGPAVPVIVSSSAGRKSYFSAIPRPRGRADRSGGVGMPNRCCPSSQPLNRPRARRQQGVMPSAPASTSASPPASRFRCSIARRVEGDMPARLASSFTDQPRCFRQTVTAKSPPYTRSIRWSGSVTGGLNGTAIPGFRISAAGGNWTLRADGELRQSQARFSRCKLLLAEWPDDPLGVIAPSARFLRNPREIVVAGRAACH
jgi:hypothetical protein